MIERYSADKEGEEEPVEGDIEVERSLPIKEAIMALETLKLSKLLTYRRRNMRMVKYQLYRP